MPEPEPAAPLSFQVLADPTGRRRHRLAIAGRIATTALALWLVALTLGGLGLQPLAGLPILGDVGAGNAEPPALPTRVRTAVARRTTVAPSTPAVQAPVPLRRPAVTAPSRTTQPSTPTRTTPAATTRTATPPGQTKTSPSSTAPGQTRIPPGQTKTEPGPPASTPGTTPQGKSNSKPPSAKGNSKTP